VPKGLWYRWNGEDKRIPDNGLFDIITGEFRDNYKMTDGAIGQHYDGSSWHDYTVYADGKDYVFLRNQKPIIGTEYDYFDDWSYSTSDIDYVVQMNASAKTYE